MPGVGSQPKSHSSSRHVLSVIPSEVEESAPEHPSAFENTCIQQHAAEEAEHGKSRSAADSVDSGPHPSQVPMARPMNRLVRRLALAATIGTPALVLAQGS